MSEKKKVDVTQTFIYHEDAPTLPPPRLEVGAIAWLRQNLFGSPADIVITPSIVDHLGGIGRWILPMGNWLGELVRDNQ